MFVNSLIKKNPKKRNNILVNMNLGKQVSTPTLVKLLIKLIIASCSGWLGSVYVAIYGSGLVHTSAIDLNRWQSSVPQ